MVKVSVVIPVYNAEKYLRQCLDSVVNQTLKEIEMICVDDGSTDSSSAILAEYAAKEPRIKVLMQGNSGTVIARKRAVEAANGEWCLFLDPDDWLAPETCATLVHHAAEDDADIIQYGFDICETVPRTSGERATSEAYFNRPEANYAGADLYRMVFIDGKLPWNLIGRMVKTAVCKPAFAEQAEVYSINETDVYAVFHLLARVKTLRVVSDRLYHYRYGVGISTKREMPLAEYDRLLGKFDSYAELKTFVAANLPGNPSAAEALQCIGRRMAISCFNVPVLRMPAQKDRRQAFRSLLAKCPLEVLTAALGEKYVDLPQALAKHIDRAGGLPEPVRRPEPKHVGIYYFHLTVGGIQKVVLSEIRGLLSLGKRVTMFVDEDAPVEVNLPLEVQLVRLPPLMGRKPASPEMRMSALAKEITSRGIDVLHSHQYITTRLIWDILACRMLSGVPFYLHYHGVRTASLWSQASLTVFNHEPCWLRQCDAVLALTEFDAEVFQAEGVNAFALGNPASGGVYTAMKRPVPEKNPRQVAWVGRLSPEKHPGDALRVFGKLHQSCPDARFVFVGGGSEKAQRQMKDLAAREELGDSIEFHWNVKNALKYYEKSSVFISTSDYEGYSLTAAEALAQGTLVVGYAQPQLPLFRGNPAVIQVEPRDVSALASEVHGVFLRDEEDLARIRKSGRRYVPVITERKYAQKLMDIFQGRRCKPPKKIAFSDFADYLELQRLAFSDLHRRRTGQIEKIMTERDRLRKDAAVSRNK